jgi:hypothetical protein
MDLRYKMSDLTYTNYNKKSLLVRGDREKYGNKLKEIGGRWNTRVKGDPGWTVPIEKEGNLKKLIASLKKEEKIEDMRTNAKSNKEQKKYHRAISESENEEKSYDSQRESEKENEKESESEDEKESESEREDKKESYCVKPVTILSPRRSEIIKPVRESHPKKERSKKHKPIYSSESESDEYTKPPSRQIKPVVEKHREEISRKIPEYKHRSDRHKSPVYTKEKNTKEKSRKEKSPPRRRRSPSLSDSESEYSSSENDFPSPRTPVKRKTREELERDMRRKLKDLERKVDEMRFEKRKYRR